MKGERVLNLMNNGLLKKIKQAKREMLLHCEANVKQT